jgi:ABC-2 type transport system permease protein
MRDFSLRKAWLITKREYLTRVRTRSFVLLTLLAPLIMAAFALGPSAIILMGSSRAKHVALAVADTAAGQRIKNSLEPSESGQSKNSSRTGLALFRVELTNDLSQESRQALEQRLESKQLDGFIWLDQTAIEQRKIEYITGGASGFTEAAQIRSAVRDVLMRDLLHRRGLNDQDIAAVTKGYVVETVRHSPGEAGPRREGAQFFTVFVLGFAMYMTVLMYGMNVMRAVMEEKNSKIMEVLMSTVTSGELLAGKIIGVAAVGLTQVATWVAMASVVSLAGFAVLATSMREANLSLATGAYFLIFFLLGYILYSTIFAVIGSIVSSEQEAQQIQFFAMLPIMMAFFFSLYAISSPSDPKSVIVSLIPLATPMVMFTRIVSETPPFWQIALSIVLTALTAALITWISARIYRVGVLMYGKRATLPEIVKWVRYS